MNANAMNADQLIYAANAMEAFGGGFVSQIARAYYAADLGNRARLVAAFGDLFERYGPGSGFYEMILARENVNG
ncbi:hypothetical protein [Limnobacter sp. P1]|uniref:hypothetical protein n=1 Tax=Limnobacter olei TaxID=3031298 RepID=UPI0023B1F5C3|nr:hypothetical protein [Limnobacter sp. P1]